MKSNELNDVISKEEEAKITLSDYLYIIIKWKNFILINFIITVGIISALVFSIPPEYKATAVVMSPPDNSSGMGGLAGLLSSKNSGISLGQKLLGGNNTSEDMLLGILNSRTTITHVINKFHLMEYYEIKDGNMWKAIKAFSQDLSFGPNEYAMLEISVINKDPKKAAEIANYFVKILDSLNIKFNVEQARNNRSFIEKRYFKNVSDLKSAEDSLYKFQKKYGIFAVPQQLEVAVKAAGELEANLTAKEIAAYFLKQQYGENSPQYLGSLSEVNLLKAKVHELKNSDKLSSESNVLFPFKHAPEMTMGYLRFYREIEIQSKIMEIILPMYEQAKVEEQKRIPTIVALDNATPPELKDSPKRGFIIAGAASVICVLLILIVFFFNSYLRLEAFKNPLQLSFNKWASFTKRFFKITG